MTINLANKHEIIAQYGKNEKDSGSSDVQIALLSTKIKELTEHLKLNKKDSQGKRGLLQMVGKRRKLLAYVKKENIEQYRDLIAKLGIRG